MIMSREGCLKMKDVMLDLIVEEINNEFYGVAKATEKSGILYVTSLRCDHHSEIEVVEDLLEDVIEYIRYEFNIDVDVLDAYKRTVAYEVL